MQHLTVEQQGNIRSSSLVLRAYNGGKINNLGQISLDLEFDDGKVLHDQEFVVTSSNRTPLLGTNILLPDKDKLVIDKEASTISIRGHVMAIHGSVPTGENQLAVGSIKIESSDQSQKVISKEDFMIPAHSTAFVSAKLKLLPSTSNFMLVDQSATRFVDGKRHVLPVAKTFYDSEQFAGFTVQLVNTSDTEIFIKKGSKLANTLPVSGEMVQASDVNHVESESSPAESRLEQIMALVSIGDVSEADKDRFKSILDKYKDIILLEDEIPSRANVEEFKVYPKEEAPVSNQNFRTPYAHREPMKKILQDFVDKGILERTSSPWNSPTMLVKKPNGSFRFVTDFRKVNGAMKSDSYPLPRIPDLLTNLKNSRYFTAFDCTSGFHQIPIHDAATKDILTIGNEFGQFRYNVMPQGFKNSPAHYQRVMDNLFRSIPASELLVYIDDLLVHSPTMEEHLTGIEKVLALLKSKNLQLKASKIHALVKSVVFCGQKIENGTLSVPESRVDAVRNQKSPRNKREAQSLFGFYNYMRNMIPNFASRAAPITASYRGGRFQWTEEAESAFRGLQKTVISGTLALAIPDTSKDVLVLETDASEHSMGGCLFMCTQTPDHPVEPDFHDHDENCLRPIAFFSKNFRPSQMRQYIREKELRSFKTGLAYYRQYLLGREFIWRTDNRCNSYANEMKSSSEKIAKILSECSEYTYKIQCRSSSQMKISDHLSRGVNQLNISRRDFASLQQNDPVLKMIYGFVKLDRWPNDKNDKRLLKEVLYWRRLRLDLIITGNGELARSLGSHQLLLVPRGMRSELIESYHDGQYHPGIENTMATMGKYYTWYGMRDDVTSFIRSCEFCQRTKPNRKPQHPPLCHTDTPKEPFQMLSIDLTGPLPKTNRNNQWIVVVNDHFSKRVYAKPVPNKSAGTVLQVLKDIVYSNPCLPKIVKSDNGLEFAGVFAKWLSENGIKQNHNAPYHPASNGLTERSNQTIKSRLMPKQNPRDWDLKLLPVIHAINMTPNEVTKCSPFEIENGIVGKNPNSPVALPSIPVEDLQKLRQSIYDLIEAEKKTRVQKFNRISFTPFMTGDEVLIKSRSAASEKYYGPFIIETVFSEGRSYKVRNVEDESQSFIRRVEELKPYTRREVIQAQQPTSVSPEPVTAPSDEDWFMLYPNTGNGWPKSTSRINLPFVGLLGSSPAVPVQSPSVPVEVVPESAPVEAVPVEAVPVEAVPVEAVPVEAVPVETVPVDATPISSSQPVAVPSSPSMPPLEGTPVRPPSQMSPRQLLTPYSLVQETPGAFIGPVNQPRRVMEVDDTSMGSSGSDLEVDLPVSSNSTEIPEVQADISEERIMEVEPTQQQRDSTMTTILQSPVRPNRKRSNDSPDHRPAKQPVVSSSNDQFMTRSGLKDFINSKSESSRLRQVGLHRITKQSDLKLVAKTYKVPVTMREPEDMKDYILKKNPKIQKLTVCGVRWPIVCLGTGWSPVESLIHPRYYAPCDQEYEQLLNLSLKWNVPVRSSDVISQEALCARLESYSKSGKLIRLMVDGKLFLSKS